MKPTYLRRPRLHFCLKSALVALFIIGLVVVEGCVSQSNRALLQAARSAKFEMHSLSVDSDELRIFARPSIIQGFGGASGALKNAGIHRLHIYLEGDGRPWINGNAVAKNPTSTHPLALKLMALDKHPSLYLNRPCYGFMLMPENCSSDRWTHGRYSRQQLYTLNRALDEIKQQLNVQSFVLIGHSGGGSLAILLAANREDVNRLITIAPNVDHRRWTDFFGYLPLSTSLNPVDVLNDIRDIEQWHFIGARDRVVPATITRLAFGFPALTLGQTPDYQFMDNVAFIHYPSFNHYCCWEKEWAKLLALTRND